MKKPPWLKKRITPYQDLLNVKTLLEKTGLHTVCEEARCPNLGECFSQGTATFLILGDICTRNCGFCAVQHGIPFPPEEDEPERIADAVREMDIRYAVITSVTRDDLPDGGASFFARTIKAIRKQDQEIKVEVLVPDFRGDLSSLKIVLNASPDVLNHNIETIQRLYSKVRPQADYKRSLRLLNQSKKLYPQLLTKSGLMLGLGETEEEVVHVMEDLREVGCDFLTIGQYLQPRPDRFPVERYVPPEAFEAYQQIGVKMGFKAVASGPFIRSSFNASQMFETNPI